MIRSLWISKTGLDAQQTNMDVIAQFLPRKFRVDRSKETAHRVDVD